MLGFFFIGTVIREHKDFLKKGHDTLCKGIPFIGVITANTAFIFFNEKVNVRTGEWAFLPLSYINALMAIWIYFCIAVFICKKKKWLGNILRYIGENSIVFVCTNHMIIRISGKFLEAVQKYSFTIHDILQEILVFVISIILMICLSEIFCRTKLKFFIGK